jgi:hypothetical protein
MDTKSVQYDIHGITIFVPPQDSGYEFILEEKTLLDFTHRTWTNHFTLIRQIANIALYRLEGEHKIYDNDFTPPIVFWVGYDTDDLMKAGCGIDRLILAYWTGTDWEPLSLDNPKYMILPPTTAQVAVVSIDHWEGDPPLAWGG